MGHSCSVHGCGEVGPRQLLVMVVEGVRNALLKSGGAFSGASTSPIMDLYRNVCREIPRILTIYDVDIDPAAVSVCVEFPWLHGRLSRKVCMIDCARGCTGGQARHQS